MDEKWVQSLERMERASRRAHEERLRSLSLEEGMRILEDLCQGIPEFDRPTAHKMHPVGLCRIWKSS